MDNRTLWSPHQQQILKWTTWWGLSKCWPLTICWNPSAMTFFNPPYIQRSSTQFCEEGRSIFLIWSQSIQECLGAKGKRESTTSNPKPKEIQVMKKIAIWFSENEEGRGGVEFFLKTHPFWWRQPSLRLVICPIGFNHDGDRGSVKKPKSKSLWQSN